MNHTIITIILDLHGRQIGYARNALQLEWWLLKMGWRTEVPYSPTNHRPEVHDIFDARTGELVACSETGVLRG